MYGIEMGFPKQSFDHKQSKELIYLLLKLDLIAFLGRIKGHSFSIFSLWARFNGLFLTQINTSSPTPTNIM
jgi:hypothetical protein